MASQPSVQINTEVQYHDAAEPPSPPQQPQLPEQGQTPPQATLPSNGLSPPVTDTPAPPLATATLPRNLSTATIGSWGRYEIDTSYPTNAPHGQVNRHSTHRRLNGRPRTGEMFRGANPAPMEERWVPTAEQRLEYTLENAYGERDKAKAAARMAKWSLAVVAGVQVFLGALTTGLSALRLEGKQLGVATTVLGILSTLIGAYLAHVRASNEPETSLLRAHDLDSFLRKCEHFILDFGYDTSDRHGPIISELRQHFETIMADSKSTTPGPKRPKKEAKDPFA